MARFDFTRVTRPMGSLAMTTSALNPTASAEPCSDEGDSREVAYLVGVDSLLCDLAVNELAAAGIEVRRFGWAGELLNCVRRDSARCIISALQLPDMTAFDLQRYVRQAAGPPTIVIRAHPDMTCGIRAIKGGAVDFLTYPVEPAVLMAAVREAFKRDCLISRQRASIAALEARHAQLTKREREVLALVVRGILNKQVAGMLAISIVTVQIHRSNVMRKMGARSFADLVCMAMSLRIIEQDLGDAANISAFDSGPRAAAFTP